MAVVDGILESMKDVICQHGRLEVRDFGVFQVKTRKARVGRNPRDKVEYPIPARKVVTFRVGKELKELINNEAGEQASSNPPQTPDSTGDPSPPDSGLVL